LRKIHKSDTPSLGGIPIFFGVVFSLIIWLPYEVSSHFKYLFSALVLTFIIGIRDDLIPLKPIYKLLSQIVPAIMVIWLQGIQINSFYEFNGIEFHPLLTYTLTAFVIVVITNSINLIDGIDGLAGSISFCALTSLGLWFFYVGYENLGFVALAFSGAIISFLIYNWSPSKIFMGDTGALLLGFIQSCFLILFININHNLSTSESLKFNNSIVTAICVMIVPLLDTLRVFILRVAKSRSPFEADNNHLHHVLIKIGLSHQSSVIALISLNLVFIFLAILMKNMNPYISIFIVISAASIFLLVLWRLLLKAQSKKTSIQ